MIEPLRLTFDVNCAPAHAFDVWTRQLGRWWPKDHSVTGDPGLSIVLEPFVRGRIYERTPDGAEHDWGEITLWEPPSRFGYLWHLRQDRADATEVEVRFAALPDGRARVEIEHRGWERLGARGPDLRNRTTAGWNGLLPHYVAAL